MIPRSEEKERVVFEFDGFRVDPVRRLLSRDGEAVSITPKALSILIALLERAGQVVEKKELIEKVWPGVFVTEANLTQNVFSLRKTLGERANENRYIATVPGQGYSFAGDLRRIERYVTAEIPIFVPDEPKPAAALPGETGAIAAEDPALLQTTHTSQTTQTTSSVLQTWTDLAAVVLPSPERRRPLVLLGVLGVLVAIGASLFFLLFPSAPGQRGPVTGFHATSRRAIAVMDFKSLAPGAETRWLDTALSEMLTTELAASGEMRVIRGETVAEAMRSLGIRDPSSIGPAELKRLHEMLGANYVVVGSYLPNRGKIRLDLRVLQAPEGNTIFSVAENGPQAGIFDLVSVTGDKLRKSLNIEALSPRQVREAQALRPASTEATRLYNEGLARLRGFDPPGALQALQQAVKADPGSPVIHSALSQTWANLGYDARAVAESLEAVKLAKSLSREERLVIEARFYKTDQDWEKASQTYRTLCTFFPDDIEYGLQLAESLMYGGRGAETLATIATLRKLPPPSGEDPRLDLLEARTSWRLSDLANEKRAAERAVAKGRKSGQRFVVAHGLIFHGDALVRTGQTQAAIPLFREAAAISEDAGYLWGIGMAQANIGVGLQVLGDLDGAQEANEKSLAIARQLGSGIAISSQLFILGGLHQDRGQLSEALVLLEQAREWYVRVDDAVMESQTLNRLGSVMLAQGNLPAARQRFERALKLSQTLGNRSDEALALSNLGTVQAALGELGEARRRHSEAFTILTRGGDASLAASALAASADAAARLGDLRLAWTQSSSALEAQRKAHNQMAIARILGSRAWLAYEMGDLAVSRALAREQLEIAREVGAKSLAVWALQNLGRVDFAAGDLAGARKSLQESLETSTALGENLRAMEVRLDLAALALAAGHPGEAAVLASEAAAWYQARKIEGGEVRSLALLAEAFQRQGLREESSRAAAEARADIEDSEDHQLRATVSLSLARLAVATGDTEDAVILLRHAIADAKKAGFTIAGLEARLALAEVQKGLGDPGANVTLAAVLKEAEALGFKRLALSAGLRPVPSVARTPPVSG
jgi:DNA-binding winged helix-turn-helix (wHTH) protein/tetratricopeptide (TPR) repeat protein/TolB-like protein